MEARHHPATIGREDDMRECATNDALVSTTCSPPPCCHLSTSVTRSGVGDFAPTCSPLPSTATLCEATAALSLRPADGGSASRLAGVNSFTLNPDEPRRNLQELVEALMEALEAGKSRRGCTTACATERRTQRAADDRTCEERDM
jgi:hypothetical protein